MIFTYLLSQLHVFSAYFLNIIIVILTFHNLIRVIVAPKGNKISSETKIAQLKLFFCYATEISRHCLEHYFV